MQHGLASTLSAHFLAWLSHNAGEQQQVTWRMCEEGVKLWHGTYVSKVFRLGRARYNPTTAMFYVCRFIQVAYPTSAEGLQAAGVLEADALLLGPEEGVRDSSAEADAQVRDH